MVEPVPEDLHGRGEDKYKDSIIIKFPTQAGATLDIQIQHNRVPLPEKFL